MWVIKLGGGVGNAASAVLDDIAALSRAGHRLVLVHGGSAEVDRLAVAIGHPPRFVTSISGYTSRRTDRQTARLFATALAGRVNSELVEGLQRRGVNTVGLSGLDGRLLEGRRKKAIKVVEHGRKMVLRDDYTGVVQRVNADLLQALHDQGYLPVISPPAISDEHEMLNVDGDRVAAAVAVALGAEQLILLTGAPGLLRDPDDPSSLLRRVERIDLDEARQKVARGRMRIKLLAATEALDGGVPKVVLAASARRAPVQAALAGEGTVIQ